MLSTLKLHVIHLLSQREKSNSFAWLWYFNSKSRTWFTCTSRNAMINLKLILNLGSPEWIMKRLESEEVPFWSAQRNNSSITDQLWSDSTGLLLVTLEAEAHNATNRCNMSPRQVAATNRLVWHMKIIVAATKFCCCNLSHEFKLVWICAKYRRHKINGSSLVTPCEGICDESLRQNLNQPMRKRQLLSRHVKFELVYISSLPKSITCTEQVSYRSDWSQVQCRRGDLSPRCVAAICRIVSRPLHVC